jgi:hypothetical protein
LIEAGGLGKGLAELFGAVAVEHDLRAVDAERVAAVVANHAVERVERRRGKGVASGDGEERKNEGAESG